MFWDDTMIEIPKSKILVKQGIIIIEFIFMRSINIAFMFVLLGFFILYHVVILWVYMY